MLGCKNQLSILLHGPPGTSKTSISMSIANKLKRDILIVDKTNAEQFFEKLTSIMVSSYVILFDDVDFWQLSDREIVSAREESRPNVVLIKLMELLNGNEHDSSCFIFTANYINQFDKALFRDGRVQLKLEITGFNNAELYNQFFENIYKDVGGDWIKSFTLSELNDLYDKKLPLCTISNLAKHHLFDVTTFIKNLKVI